LRIHAGTIEVVVGEPIPVQGRTREALIADVERFLRHELDLEPPFQQGHAS
jgi:hypothetical protein